MLTLADFVPAPAAWMAPSRCRGVDAAGFFLFRGMRLTLPERCVPSVHHDVRASPALNDEGLEGVWAGTASR